MVSFSAKLALPGIQTLWHADSVSKKNNFWKSSTRLQKRETLPSMWRDKLTPPPTIPHQTICCGYLIELSSALSPANFLRKDVAYICKQYGLRTVCSLVGEGAFSIRRLGPSFYRSPPKISGISSTPKNIWNFSNPQKYPPFYTLTLRKDPKMHRNDT